MTNINHFFAPSISFSVLNKDYVRKLLKFCILQINELVEHQKIHEQPPQQELYINIKENKNNGKT